MKKTFVLAVCKYALITFLGAVTTVMTGNALVNAQVGHAGGHTETSVPDGNFDRGSVTTGRGHDSDPDARGKEAISSSSSSSSVGSNAGLTGSKSKPAPSTRSEIE